jgi:hypothetical protein
MNHSRRVIQKNKMIQTMRVQAGNKVPVLTESGVLVVEATLAGCVLAWQLARAGCRTVLAASGCSLPHELVVVRQPWSRPSQWKDLPESFEEVFRQSTGATLASGMCLLNLARLALGIEDLLLDAGVRLFYGLTACGVEKAGNGSVTSVIFGGKGGLQAIRSAKVIDAGAGAVVARLAGAKMQDRIKSGGKVAVGLGAKVKQWSKTGPVVITRGQISDDKLEPVEDTELAAPGVGELAGQKIVLHGPYAQISLRLPVDLADPLWMSRLSVESRKSLVRIGRAVQSHRAGANKRALFFHRFSGAMMLGPVVRVKEADGSLHAEGVNNLWICGPAADVGDAQARRLADPFIGCGRAETLVKDIMDTAVTASSQRDMALSLTETTRQATCGQLCFSDAPDLHAVDHVTLPKALDLPLVDQSDVLVVGAGTSGVPCALAAAGASVETTLVDQHADVGGVRTIGGVGSYWFGRPTSFQNACDLAYDKVTGDAGVAEEVSMMQCLLDANVKMLTHCPVAGVVAGKGKVWGVVIVTSAGLAVVSGKMIVDATGDADLAAWAGAPFEYGNGRDAFTLWGSFGNFNHEKRTSNRQYESTIEVRDAWDFTRNIVRGRRRPGMWKGLEHEMPQHYVTPRETRRILTTAGVTYSGILAGETFEDVMVVCESNFDIKGLATSDIGACGVVSSWDVYEKFQAAIPWRAVHPGGLDNVLVAGRAYGASHDAIALARMQRDMVSLGGAVGLAAAKAVVQGISPKSLAVDALKKDWLALGVIRPEDQERYEKPWQYTKTDAQKDCQALLTRKGRWNACAARLMRTNVSVPALRRAFRTAAHQGTKVRLARALGVLGDSLGAAFLLEVVASQTAKVLPRPLKKHLAIPPEHGWAGDPVYSLRAVGLAGAGEQAAAMLGSIARKIEDNAERFASQTDSQFEYVQAICFVAERNPGPWMIPALHVLYRRRCLHGLWIPWERDMRFTVDPTLERRSYLEVCVARALARCADARGYEVLLRYADDVRGTLARSASDELCELMGQKLPGSIAARRRTMDVFLSMPLVCKPFVKRID